MEKINHQHGFVGFVALFLLLAFAYIVGGGVVERKTQEGYEAAALRMQQEAETEQLPDGLTPELE